MTFLGFDYGEKAIGVAVGGAQSGLAEELDTVRVGRSGPDWRHIAQLIDQWQPGALIVGLPRNMDDSPNRMTEAAERFGNRLGARYNLPIHMVDERLTTVAARDTLAAAGVSVRRQQARVDRLAAKFILQAFLDEHLGQQRARGR